MAQLDVQPKRRGPVWIWLIFFILAIGVAVLLYRGCNKSAPLKTDQSDTTKTDTTAADNTQVAITQPDWNAVDFTLPKTAYDEVTDTAIVVRGNNKYTIYSLGETVLFAPEQSTLQPGAEARLKQVAASLAKRFKSATIGIYGHADSTGTAGQNKALGADRAIAVKDWLLNKGGISGDKLSVHSLGEEQPLATNATKKGRAQNRSVVIVAFPDSTGH